MLPKELSLKRLGGKFAELDRAIAEGLSTSVFYCSQNARYHLTTATGRFFLYVTPDRIGMREAREILADYCGGEVVIIPEKDDLLLNLRINLSSGIAERTSALASILTGKARGAVISAEGLMQYFPYRKSFEQGIIELKKGDCVDVAELVDRLVACGYRRADQVEDSGEFSQRGELFDIWCADSEMPVRLDFFGDEIESMRLFAPDTMVSVKETDSVTIIPKSDILVSQKCAEQAIKRLGYIKRNAKRRLAEIIEATVTKLEAYPSDPALIWALPFIKEELSTLFDYLPSDAVIVLDEPKLIEEKFKLVRNAHTVRAKEFIESGEATKEHLGSMMDTSEAIGALRQRQLIGFQQATSANPIFDPRAIVNIKGLPLTKYNTNYEAFVADIRAMAIGGGKSIIYAGNAETAGTLSELLRDNEISAHITEDTGEDYPVLLVPERLARGFIYPDVHLMIVGTDDIIKRTETHKRTSNRKRAVFVMPEKGDYVVHEKHGIGISEGLVTLTTSLGTKDYLCIMYRGGDKLYLPADKMDEVDKYTGGGTPPLHKLGGREFDRVKERVRASVKEMAIDLVKLYTKRLKAKGHKYQPDTVWQKELEDSFPYSETDDQLIAISEIKEDMESGKVMDRLLCGDVGFGKTEVAIRAIFKTIIEGKQAAFLSPTTILCQQHYNTIRERFAQFGITIDVLSRFVPQSEIKESLKRIKSGKTSVVVATHRLLGKDVEFKDLGLLVLDEEQRFGVEHKEKIKALKTNVNVLSLSATPIPRTLHMALSGIRDISTLETPPENRLPVETYVVECTDALIRDACARELARGGQVFILYNSVQDIEKYADKVDELLEGKARIIYAHGQMEEGELAERIKRFYDKEADVLVATTIIENGIDIPDANTLIVIDADKLGLSALYQLRGRVGRSRTLAYAYFTVREGKVLTEDATKRLDALSRYTELGSGFKIAMQDLEIRGAGNILGKEQHGNMEKVGYDMYCKILKECVDEIEGRPKEKVKEVEMDISGDTSLPKDYIKESAKRVAFYKTSATLSSYEDMQALEKETCDIYGTLPQAAKNLMNIGLIKNLAAKLHASKVVATEKGMGIHFYDQSIYSKEGLFKAMSENVKSCVLSPSDPPVIIFDNKNKTTGERLELLRNFLITATSC